MQLGKTKQYDAAIAALTRLKDQLGLTDDLKSIARFLLYCEPADAPALLFPFVGTDDPRDQAVVEGYKQAWDSFLEGNDE